MSLREIVADLLEEFEPYGGAIQMHNAVKAGRPRVLADPEATNMLIDEGLYNRLKQTGSRHLKAMRSCGAKVVRGIMTKVVDDKPIQLDMFERFGLRPRYALDIDARELKRTDWLTRAEWRRIIALREDQMIADAAHLEKLRAADRELTPAWDLNPTLLFGQVAALVEAEGD